jgi:type IV secretion system protein TrbL
MNGTGIIDRFLAVFSRYIDSGFGLLHGDVAFIASTLVAIDVTLAALFWAWGEHEDIVARLVRKTLFVGMFSWLIGNWNHLASLVFTSFAGLGLKASGTATTTTQLLQPGRIAQVGLDAGRPLLQAIADLMGYVSFFENFVQIVVLLGCWVLVVLAFFVLAIQLFVTLVEFKLTTLAGFVLVPFGLFGKTAFLAERVLGNVAASGIKVLVLAVIVGIGSTIFGEFTAAISGTPTLEDAMTLVLASLTLLALAIFGPGIASGLVSGGPQLGAGAAAAAVLGAGGVAAGGAAAAGMVGGATAAAAMGTLRGASAAGAAYREGATGHAGLSAVAHGLGQIGSTAARAATAPLRKAGVGSGEGGRNEPVVAPGAGGSAEPAGPPAWARALRRRQALGQGAMIAAHTLRSGDSQGAGTSIDTSQKED